MKKLAVLIVLLCFIVIGVPAQNAIQIEMVNIPAGTIVLSDRFTVDLSAFKMSKYHVTQAQYEAVMGYNPSRFTKDAATGEVQAKRPVEQATWYDAVEFCNKLSVLEGRTPVYTITDRAPSTGYPIIIATVTEDFSKNGYRLPTEAQWEYAARAGSKGKYSKGIDNIEVDTTNLGNYAWYSENSGAKTHEVGKKIANAFGLFDMHGNVMEWCWDRYGTYPSGTRTDYTGAVAGSLRVVRNFGWRDSARNTESSFRHRLLTDAICDYLGFRLVCP